MASRKAASALSRLECRTVEEEKASLFKPRGLVRHEEARPKSAIPIVPTDLLLSIAGAVPEMSDEKDLGQHSTGPLTSVPMPRKTDKYGRLSFDIPRTVSRTPRLGIHSYFNREAKIYRKHLPCAGTHSSEITR